MDSQAVALATPASGLDLPTAGGSDGKASVYSMGDRGLNPGLGRSLEKEMAKNPMDRGAWQATVHGIAESDTTERLQFQFQY